MKRLMLILPAAVLLLSGCAVYEPGPVYPAGYYAPPRAVYGYPTYVAPPVYGGVWLGGGHRGHGGGYRGGYRGHGGHWR